MKLDLKLYRGYANQHRIVVSGHVFESWAPDKYRVDRKGIRHAFAIIHMFRIKPIKNARVTLRFRDLEVSTRSWNDGFFRFDVPVSFTIESGWHNYSVSLDTDSEFNIVETGEFLKPYESRLGIISDIDDTFLLSHSANFFKKLYVMLYRNVNKRRIFDGVVRHYQLLSKSGQSSDGSRNSFFYVSSSEWNLYNFVDEFARIHELPKAVFKLKSIKTGISDFLFSGMGNHDHKFHKIKDIITFYPDLGYVLLGDDTQRDPYIYEKIVKIFPGAIRAVYIRQTGKFKSKKVWAAMHTMESLGVEICYFKSSKTAIEHSESIGLI